MKSKITFLVGIWLITINCAKAQQSASLQKQPVNTPAHAAVTNYTYQVYQAPNKNFGYDILLNGKIVYHEFAAMSRPDNIPQLKNSPAFKSANSSATFSERENTALSKKEHAEKAALMSIDKMKKKESPSLSKEELKKIFVH